MISAPPQTAGKLGVDVPDGEIPSSAGIGTGKGKKSFLRPFLLGGRKKKGEMPAAAMHKSRKEEEFDVQPIEQMVDDHLQVEFEIPESTQEIIASTPQYEIDGNEHGSGEASPVWAPLAGKKGVSKRVAEMRVDGSVPASPWVVTPITPNIPLTPITSSTPASPSIVDSPIPSPISTPTTAVNQLTPVETDIPLTPEPTTPITATLAVKTPPSRIRFAPNTPMHITPTIPTSKSSAHREPSRDSDHGHDRHHHRNPEETSDERRKRKDREHARREEGSEGEWRARSSRSQNVEKEDTWLEVVFEDLPFGPDKNMVSPPSSSLSFSFLLFLSSTPVNVQSSCPRVNIDTQSRAMESIKRDYKIFLAEIIALVGVAYVIQRSGW
jgi:hypothetical protein